MSTFSNILRGVTRHVVDSALTAAANRTPENHNVHEIHGRSSMDDVARYPVASRVGCLVLHGPIEPGGFFSHRPTAFNIILHVPGSTRMFSLYRTDRRDDAEATFIVYKDTFPLLVQCDPSLCDYDKLDKIVRKLQDNLGWTAPHIAAALGFQACLRHPSMKDKLNDQEGDLLRTPLLVAIVHDNLASISTLLELGVALDIKDVKENTVFHLAASQSQQTMHLLLDKVPISKRDLLNFLNAEGCTPLHLACKSRNSELLKSLLIAGADVNIPSSKQGYPIHCAVKANSICSIQELVKRYPSQLQFKDLQEGGSPLHWSTGREITLSLLELGCDPNIANDSGVTPLHDAARRGCLKSTLSLLCHGAFTDMKDQNGDTPLHVASRLCSLTVMQALIVFGADINITNGNGDTPRHLVCTSQRSDKDHVLYILHAVGAKRCHESKQTSCVEGCIFSGLFGGIQPENFPNLGKLNLMHETLYAFSVKKGVERSVGEAMEIDGITLEGDGPSTSTNAKLQIGGRLLCLDGGGIRGIVLTQMLLVMEQEFGIPVIDMFDWVAGTSTGGILALALACGKSALETQAIYLRLKDKVFIGERPYSGTVMEEFLKQEFGSEKKMSSIIKPRVMIMTALVDRRPADLHIFRNYKSPARLIGEQECCVQNPDNQFVWETAKVTGAAPSYFRLDHDQFIDGGLIANNPTLDALTELHQFSSVMGSLGNLKNGSQFPTAVVSLGTGIQPKTEANASLLDITWPSGIVDAITKVPRLASLVNLLVDQATQTEGQVVERSRAWCSSIGIPFFRYSPQMSSFMELDEKDDTKLINLLWETRCYMVANKDTIVEMKKVLFNCCPLPTATV